MRAVIQRVSEATVSIDGHEFSSIRQGLLVLLGVENEDNQDDITWLLTKILNLRIFNDQQQVMNLSLLDVKGELMVVSQFTLHAQTKKGNRPSYIKAAKHDVAIPMYESFIRSAERLLDRNVATGQFGADMKVCLVNDGPVTIIIDSKQKE